MWFSCGLALDQDWMPPSFASAFGADWCLGLIGTPASGTFAYPVGFSCDFSVNAFAVQDPGKTIGVVGLTLTAPLTGTCQAPFQQSYIGVCSLTSPLLENSVAAFKMTLAGNLAAGSKFGLSAFTGSTGTQRNLPLRVIDQPRASAILAAASKATPGYASSIDPITNAVDAGRLTTACELIRREIYLGTPSQVHLALTQAAELLDCSVK